MYLSRVWEYPLITRLRQRIREMTPGEIPPMKTEHPVAGLLHDIQRYVRRRIFQGRGRGQMRK